MWVLVGVWVWKWVGVGVRGVGVRGFGVGVGMSVNGGGVGIVNMRVGNYEGGIGECVYVYVFPYVHLRACMLKSVYVEKKSRQEILTQGVVWSCMGLQVCVC